MKKYAHLTSAHRVGDTRILLKECQSLKKNGYDISLIAVHNKDEIVAGIPVIAVKKNKGRLSRYIKTAKSVYDKAVLNEIDICHFHDPELIPFCLLLRMKGKKVIYDVHEDLPKQILSKEWIPSIVRYPVACFFSFLEWFSSKYFFSAIVAATPKISKRFPLHKTSLVQNFPLKNELVREKITPYSERPLYIVYVGGIAKIRGICEVVSALGIIKNKSIKLQLAGRFESELLLHSCKALNGWNKVDYKGFLNREEVATLLDQSRLGLVIFYPEPNHIDAQPNKLFEYMSAGIPVIVSDFPLWRNIVEDADCGILVDPMDKNAIASAIEWLISNPEDAERMGQNGQEQIMKQYNWTHEEVTLLRLYQELEKL